MAKIYRKYPEKINFENSLKELSESFDKIKEPEAEANAIWLIGEYYE